jgi:hypothetical protein
VTVEAVRGFLVPALIVNDDRFAAFRIHPGVLQHGEERLPGRDLIGGERLVSVYLTVAPADLDR